MAEMREAIENGSFQAWQAQFARDRATKSVQ
jgi:queuine/archaeosine tRNA-ribosyltransferase